MKQDKISVIGEGGSGSAPAPYVPVEDNNTLQANTYANIVDLIAEGEIDGPAIDNNWYKSTFLNEVPVQNPSSLTETYNYTGITIVGNNGTETQDFLPGFSPIEAEVVVDTNVTKTGGGITRSITDSNVDNVKVTIQLPALLKQEDNGDKKETTLQIRVSITPDNGAGTKQVAINEETQGKIFGKCISEYRKQFEIRDLSQYGSAPWVITVERITDDSETLNIVNAFKWYSYTTQIDTKLRYYDRAVVGMTINSSQFGNTLPTRAYKINGRKIKVPSNYDAVQRGYTGDWDGTFILATTNNPAWIVYDLLTNSTIGLGDIITEDMVDKWGLYTCGQYCDQLVSYSTMTINTSGSHTADTGTENRYSFNSVIESRAQALEVITHLCSVMCAYTIWSSGMLKFVQDRPITSPARPVGLSNVSPDGFEYQGIPKRNKHTVVRVSWNNPDKFGKLDTLELVDEQGIRDFGYNELDFSAFGCTSRTEAIRRGRNVLYTDTHTGSIVKFAGNMEFADCIPGDLLAIQDEFYAGVSLEGRIKSSTTTSIVLDRPITFVAGNTYTALIQQPYTTAVERQLTNSPGTSSTLTWTTALAVAPQYEGMVIISSTNIATRKFVVASISEVDNYFNISAIEYDANKYSAIETGVVGEIPVPNTTLISSSLTPPTSISVEGFTYTEGDQDIRKFGIQIGWIHSTDPRTDSYELRYKPTDGGWKYLGETRESNYDWRDTKGDVYDIGVRAKGVGLVSEWLTYTDFSMDTDLTGLAAPTNLNTLSGDGFWTGADCTIVWEGSIGSQYDGIDVGSSNIGYYKVEVRKPDTTLIRSFNTASKTDTTYTYTYQDNVNDNTTPLRQLLFYVYTVDVFNDASATYATLSASNPAPDMSGVTPILESKFGYLKASWTISADKDISYYKVYVDIDNTPATVHSVVNHPTNTLDINGLSADIDYYCQIEPYDLFGAGVKSLVSGAETIYQIPSINIDIELTESVIKTDSDSNTTATLEKLYNGALSTDGVSYTVSGTDKYIQYQYGVEDYFDRIGLWTSDANGKIYIAYSTDGTNWTYLKAESDHTLDGNDMLLTASSQSDARTNYFQLVSGKNYAIFTNNIVAKYIRLYLTGTYTTTLYEFVPARILIAELAAIGHLSAYSSNIGTMVSGRLQNTANTTYFDLDANRLKLGDKFDFNDGILTLGYSDISDAPTSLNDINEGEWAELQFVKVYVSSSVFKFEAGSSTPLEETINLTASLSNGLTTYDWEYWTGSAWANLSGTNTDSTYSLSYNNIAWTTSTLKIRCISGTHYTEKTLTKIYDGVYGLNQATVYFYQRAATQPSQPSGTITYTFATGETTGTVGSWVRNVPTGTNPVWIISASAISTSSTYAIAAASWSTAVVMAENGADGIGEDGFSGLNTAVVLLYVRSATTPTKPSTSTTYTFSTGVATGMNNSWTQGIPATNGNPLWVIQSTATVTAPTDTDTILSSEWGTQIKIVEDGADGETGATGPAGAAGFNQATIYLYQRKATAPAVTDIADPTTYTFSTGALSGTLGSWTRNVPSGTNPLYIISAAAVSTSTTDTIARSEWSTPVILAENGAVGVNGLNTAVVLLYVRSATTPTKPSTSTTYTFSTGIATGMNNSWTQAVPVTNGNPLWVIQSSASATAPTDTDTILSTEWGTQIKIVEDGADGATGATGPAGAAGLSQATIYLYQRKSTVPAVTDIADPTTYTFSTGGLSGTLGSWTRSVPTGTSPLYVISAVAVSASTTDTIARSEWSTPVILAENGINGTNGTSGLNTAVVFLYIRSATTPTKPSTSTTYTFSTGIASGMNNSWTQAVPATNGNPLWVIQSTASATAPTNTDTILSSEWGTQIKIVEDGATGPTGPTGAAGFNQATIYLYQRKSTVPAVTDIADPTTYTFSTGALSGTLGAWTRSVPTGTSPLYVVSAAAVSASTTDTIARSEWSTPVILAENGTTGTSGANGVTSIAVLIYVRAASLPTKPSATTTYTFSTGVLTGLNNSWTRTIPTTNGNPVYVSQAMATATAPATTDTILSTEWATPTILAEYAEPGATNDSDLYYPGTTIIDGGKIHAASSITIGNTVNGSYSVMNSGDIVFYNYFTGIGHQPVKSLKKVEVGVCTNGVQCTLPGYWKTQPKIMISPNNIQTFNKAYVAYNQTLTCQQPSAVQTSTGVWAFTPTVALSLADGTQTGIITTNYDYYPTYNGTTISTTAGTGTQYWLGANIRSIVVVVKVMGWIGRVYVDTYGNNQNGIFSLNTQLMLQYYSNGLWRDTTWQNVVMSTTWNNVNFSIPTQGYDITHLRMVQKSTYSTPDQAAVNLLYNAADIRVRIQTTLDSYTALLASGSILATGTLNYLAISES